MNSLGQWVHQHNFLLLVAAILAGSLLVLVFHYRRSFRAWAVWSLAAGLGVSANLALRTPAVSLSEHSAPADTPGGQSDVQMQANDYKYSEPEVQSVEDIESLLASGGKQTLVEIYADHGFS